MFDAMLHAVTERRSDRLEDIHVEPPQARWAAPESRDGKGEGRSKERCTSASRRSASGTGNEPLGHIDALHGDDGGREQKR